MCKRIIALVFAFVLILNIVGCGKNNSASVDAVYALPLDDGGFAYTVIYGNDNSDEISNAVSKISLAVKKNLKLSMKSKADNKVKYSKDNYELLLGSTNRPESQKAMELLEQNRKNNSKDAIVAVIDNKIVINSKNMEVLQQTVEWFADTFLASEEKWNLLNSNYKYIYEYDKAMEFKIGDNSLLNYSIVTRQDASLVYGTYIAQLQELIESKTCYDIPLITDETTESEYEIIIGSSSRKESEISLEKNQFTICIKGNKLIVLGSNDESTAYAVRKLYELISDENNNSIPSDYQITEKFAPENDDYKLVYADEFNSLNKNYWVGYSNRKEGVNQFGKTEHNLGNKNIFIRDGMAVLPAWIDPTTWETYTSQLEYQGNHLWKYGIIEIRTKWAGYSSTTSFWAHTPQVDYENQPAPGVSVEYDMIENFGNPDSFSSNIHRWWKDKANNWTRHLSLDGSIYAEKKRYSLPQDENFSDEFHTFSMKWSPEEIEFAVDGIVYMYYDLKEDWDGYGVESYKWPIDRVHITNSIGEDASYNKVLWQEGDPMRYEFLIDYYRIYQRDSDGGFSEIIK